MVAKHTDPSVKAMMARRNSIPLHVSLFRANQQLAAKPTVTVEGKKEKSALPDCQIPVELPVGQRNTIVQDSGCVTILLEAALRLLEPLRLNALITNGKNSLRYEALLRTTLEEAISAGMSEAQASQHASVTTALNYSERYASAFEIVDEIDKPDYQEYSPWLGSELLDLLHGIQSNFDPTFPTAALLEMRASRAANLGRRAPRATLLILFFRTDAHDEGFYLLLRCAEAPLTNSKDHALFVIATHHDSLNKIYLVVKEMLLNTVKQQSTNTATDISAACALSTLAFHDGTHKGDAEARWTAVVLKSFTTEPTTAILESKPSISASEQLLHYTPHRVQVHSHFDPPAGLTHTAASLTQLANDLRYTDAQLKQQLTVAENLSHRLDTLEATNERLTQENNELRRELAAVRSSHAEDAARARISLRRELRALLEEHDAVEEHLVAENMSLRKSLSDISEATATARTNDVNVMSLSVNTDRKRNSDSERNNNSMHEAIEVPLETRYATTGDVLSRFGIGAGTLPTALGGSPPALKRDSSSRTQLTLDEFMVQMQRKRQQAKDSQFVEQELLLAEREERRKRQNEIEQEEERRQKRLVEAARAAHVRLQEERKYLGFEAKLLAISQLERDTARQRKVGSLRSAIDNLGKSEVTNSVAMHSVQCANCQETRLVSALVTIPQCGHKVCRDTCLQRHLGISLKLNAPISCPVGSRRLHIRRGPSIGSSLEPAECSATIHYKEVSAIKGARCRQCPSCAVWVVQSISDSSEQSLSQKPRTGMLEMRCRCGSSFCFECGQSWPCGSHS